MRPGEVRGNSPQVIRGTGKVGDIALMQLAWWEAKADEWPVYFAVSGTGDSIHMHCGNCAASIVKLQKDQEPYILPFANLTSQLVAHLRNRHREIEENGI